MKLYYEEGKFKVKCGFFEKGVVKNCGFKWDTENKVWYTDSISTARTLEILTGHLFSNMPIEEIIHTKYIPAPSGLSYMKYQIDSIIEMEKKERVLLADEMGLGKTIQIIGLINLLEYNSLDLLDVLIVCPNSLKLNWRNELLKWLVKKDREILVVYSNSFEISIFDRKGKIYIVNYDIVKKYYKFFSEKVFDLVVFDEAHYLKNKNAERTIYSKKIVEKVDRIILATGTPIMNRPSELISLLKIIKSKLVESISFFYYNYCMPERFKTQEEYMVELNKLNRKLLEDCMIRRTKQQVLKQLPAKVRKVIELEPARDIEKETVKKEIMLAMNFKKERDNFIEEINKLKQTSQQEYEEKVKQMKAVIGVRIQEMAKLRIELALLKIPYIKEAVETLVENNEKAIIFAYHKVVIEELLIAMSEYNPLVITGDTPIEDRHKNVKMFQEDDIHKVIILNIRAGGLGLTLHRANTVLFAELDWTPASITQAEDRAHRIGQKDTVFVYHYLFNKTIDSYLAKKIISKQKIIDNTIDTYRKDYKIDLFEILDSMSNYVDL